MSQFLLNTSALFLIFFTASEFFKDKNRKVCALTAVTIFLTVPFSLNEAITIKDLVSFNLILAALFISLRLKVNKILIFVFIFISILIIFINQIGLDNLQTSTFFSDPGIIDTTNKLRGEDGTSLLGKVLHNKSLFVYKYLENLSSLINPSLIFNYLSFLLIPLIIGVYSLIQESSEKVKPILIYIGVTSLLLALLRTEIIYRQYYLLIPALIILVIAGLNKFNKKLLIMILISNLMLNLVLRLFL